MSEKPPPGLSFSFGLFIEDQQIGYIAYSNYTPKVKTQRMILHANRLVIHPEYCGLGIAEMFVCETAKIMKRKNFEIFIKFSSGAVKTICNRSEKWILKDTGFMTPKFAKDSKIRASLRNNVKWWSYKFIG